jgi:hypothetical protein
LLSQDADLILIVGEPLRCGGMVSQRASTRGSSEPTAMEHARSSVDVHAAVVLSARRPFSSSSSRILI